MAEGLADGHIHAPPEIKTPRDGFKGRMEVTEERISELEDRTLEITHSGQQRGNRLEKSEQTLRDLWKYNERSNICIIRVPKREEKRWRG